MRRAPLFALLAASAASLGAGGKSVRVEARHDAQVFVPAGTFQMGIPEDQRKALLGECASYFDILDTNTVCEHYDIEMQHMEPRAVFVSAFWMDRDEVTVAAYRACVAGGGCSLDPLIDDDERYLVPDWPLVNVTWDEAQAYCRWRGGALPTEAQWERAARGDTESIYPWGDTSRPNDLNHGQPRAETERKLDRTANIEPYEGNPDASDGARYLAPVGSYRWGEGPYGTRDQAGNAAEWTADAYMDSDPMTTGGYDDLGSVDPVRVGTIGADRVVRGGSWRQPIVLARSNVRDPYQHWLIHADRRYPFIGFRCARPVR
jgi:formylglycine-generating enzyme required for sulfatase activity